MKKFRSYSYLSLRRHPVRTLLLGLLTALLALSLLLSIQMTDALKDGMTVLDRRLGADITVVPFLASTMSKVDDVSMQSHPGYFYMDRDVLEEVAEVKGVKGVSWQYYIAQTTMKNTGKTADVFGIDPETDFTIKPWLRELGTDSMKAKGRKDTKVTSASLLDDRQVWAGCDLGMKPGDDLGLFGVDCTVTGILDRTGTSMDTSFYVSQATTELIIDSLMEAGTNPVLYQMPDKQVSTVLVKAADENNVDGILGYINIHVDDIKAYRARSSTTQSSDSIAKAARLIGGLSIVVCILTLAILSLIFHMLSQERRREFATLRVLGASRKMLSGVVMKEGLVIGALFGAIGSLAGLLLTKPMTSALFHRLNLPVAAVSELEAVSAGASAAGAAAISFLISVIGSCLAASITAYRVSKADPGTALRRL